MLLLLLFPDTFFEDFLVSWQFYYKVISLQVVHAKAIKIPLINIRTSDSNVIIPLA